MTLCLSPATDAASARYTPEGVAGSVDLAVERTLAYARAEIHNRRAIDLAWCEFPDQDFEAIRYWATPRAPRAPGLRSGDQFVVVIRLDQPGPLSPLLDGRTRGPRL